MLIFKKQFHQMCLLICIIPKTECSKKHVTKLDNPIIEIHWKEEHFKEFKCVCVYVCV